MISIHLNSDYYTTLYYTHVCKYMCVFVCMCVCKCVCVNKYPLSETHLLVASCFYACCSYLPWQRQNTPHPLFPLLYLIQTQSRCSYEAGAGCVCVCVCVCV